MNTVRWLLLLLYWAGPSWKVEIYVDSEASCHRAAASINAMLEDHLVASGHSREAAREILDKDYVCIPTK